LNSHSHHLLSPASAAEYLGTADAPVSVATLNWWRVKGRGPTFVKIGRRVFYRQSDLDAFISAGITNPEAVRQ